MTARSSAATGCELPAVARGMCNAHYARARREGRKTEIPAPPEDRPATDYSRRIPLRHKVKWTCLQRRKRPPEAATPEGQPRRLTRSRTA